MTRTYKIYDIEWNGIGGNASAYGAGLPSSVHAEIELPDDIDGDGMDDMDREEFIGGKLNDWLSDHYGFCADFSFIEKDEDDEWDDEDDDGDSPSEDEILDRIGVALDGHFCSVDNVPGAVYVNEGGATYLVSVKKCDSFKG